MDKEIVMKWLFDEETDLKHYFKIISLEGFRVKLCLDTQQMKRGWHRGTQWNTV